MKTPVELLTQLRTFSVKTDGMEVVSKTGKEFVDLNKDQMIHGESNLSGVLIGYYSERWPEYKAMKEQLNPLANGTVDLKLTGQFHAGMFMELQGETINVSSKDSKAKKLEDKYKAESIYGLNPDNQTIYNQEVVFPGLLQKLKEKTGLSN